MKKINLILIIPALLVIGVSSCIKKDFDVPPNSSDVDPNLPVNLTIKSLKSRYDVEAFSRKPIGITDDVTIYGIVTANDASGNFYKQIIIQDSTGAIAINMNRTGIAGDFPVGRKVYVKCQGLSIGDYGKFRQLGYGLDANGNLGDIPSILMDDFIIQASYPHVVQPIVVTVAATNKVNGNEDLVGMLVQYERVEFDSKEVGLPIAEDPNNGSGTNRTITSCDKKTILLRTSNYANFQASVVPNGSGELTAIYSRFNNAPQLIIRDLEDVNFTQERCPFGSSADALIRIDSLRKMYTSVPVLLGNLKIRGTVISDRDEKFGNNITSRNMVLQDGERGIVIRFAANTENTWALNDSVEILLNGHTLNEFGKLLQIGDAVLASNVRKLGTGNVTPRIATIQQIKANFEDWESTLVTIKNALFVSGTNSTYQNTIYLNDGSTATDFPMFTQSYAEFANVPAPIGETKSVTGFLYSTTTVERISIRRLTDVQ